MKRPLHVRFHPFPGLFFCSLFFLPQATTQELQQKRHDLQRWREDIDSKQYDVKLILRGLRTVKQQFTVLDGRLGNFEDIWKKLMKDIQELNDRLENPWLGGTEQDFEDRIRAEGMVYKEIRGALEMYAIQSQISADTGSK
ncbi:hypothetical protein BDZ94DRAFT_865338 [Collybia nuda]|uniref:Uncharacterized protein n=1 Tax=Collybia nuda TaxID=64659 RepID=A0A9P5Y1I3_9AGAR|nr:hypothetical protein BDZ94DRAFT_865338 [Collybia nuda]